MKFSLASLLELFNLLGPKLQEALPLIIQLIKLFAATAGANGGAVSYSMPATPSAEFTACLDAAKKHGADENLACDAAQLVQAMNAKP